MSSGVTNTAGGIDRNVFEYECSVAAAATCPASTAEYSKIVNVGLSLWVDADRTDRVSELDVSTSVFLRNQNEGPTASASWTKIALQRQVLLNGSGSTDPEGRTLEYFWFEDTAADRRGARGDPVHGHAGRRRLAGRDVPQAVRHQRRRRLDQELLPARA